MDFREEKPRVGKLEYVLISVLAIVVAWAAWVMLEPVLWPVIDQFVQSAFEEVAATATPTPAPSPRSGSAGSAWRIASSLSKGGGWYDPAAGSPTPEYPPAPG
jgi:hypothetical protein